MKFWRKPLDADRWKTPKGEIHILPDRCKGCMFCIEFCPNEVLEESDEFNEKGYHPPRVKNPDACTDCGLCGLICPEFAVYTVRIEEGGEVVDEESIPAEREKKGVKT